MTDRERLLACRTEEEYEMWLWSLILQDKEDREDENYICLICVAMGPNCYPCSAFKPFSIKGNCTISPLSERYYLAWDRLRRAGIV